MPALIHFIVTGRCRNEVDEVVESDIATIFTLNFPGEAWARHGVEHPMGAEFRDSDAVRGFLAAAQRQISDQGDAPSTDLDRRSD